MSQGPSDEAPRKTPHVTQAANSALMVATLRIFALASVAICGSFLLSNYLTFWWKWPGLNDFLSAPGATTTLGWMQLSIYMLSIIAVIVLVLRTPERALHEDSEMLSDLTAYIIRAAYWAVLLIGLVDVVISFLRVEGLLVGIVGEQLASDLGRSSYRGNYVHYPILVVSMVIAYFSRSLGFTWLALLIVTAEIQIVIARFIFSYEQAFMGDLVRFWYGALFLFASAYTLIEEGHVRVDILYASFSERGKAWTNVLGSVFLGMPLCWLVLTLGMWGRSNVITGPLLTFEVTQSGYGLYVKYLLAAFLLVYAITMLIEFASYMLRNAAVLLHEDDYHPDLEEHAKI
jgi:TRAP-type mannitol/chloroaromatic compound transport system permease small subunit